MSEPGRGAGEAGEGETGGREGNEGAARGGGDAVGPVERVGGARPGTTLSRTNRCGAGGGGGE